LAFFRDKGLAMSFAWQDRWQEEHDAAFTVAKMMNVDLLRDTRAAVDKAIAEGQTFEMFRDNIEGRLVEAGWWGKAEMVDPNGGEKKLVQLGSPRRLRTIDQTNMMSAYAAGQWQEIQESKASAPYLMYDAVDDDSTREEHAAWDGTVLPADDPWWSTHMPPNGWNCRCGVVQLSGADVQSMGLQVSEKAPPSNEREYTNPRTGEVSMVPQGIDPGWAYNPGASRQQRVVDDLAGKAAAAEPEIGAEVMKHLSPDEASAFDASHASWVDEVLAADAPRSSWRLVGGLAVDDLKYLEAKGIAPQSAMITLDSRLLLGPKARRHAEAGDALSAAEWKRLSADMRTPDAVLFDKESGRLHYVLPGTGKQPRLVVAIDFNEGKRRTNSVRSAFKVDPDALRDTRSYELIRGAVK
jgi:SPP1 gp7 family putative phage head morphogenesis protein